MSKFPCSFAPWDSDTWCNVGGTPEEFEYEETESDPAPIPNSPGMYPLPQISLSESESDVPVATNSDHCVTTTDVKNLRAVIQTKTHYDGSMNISSWLKYFPGLIIMPLDSISFIRKPVAHHNKNPQVLVYLNKDNAAGAYPDFQEAVDFFYSK